MPVILSTACAKLHINTCRTVDFAPANKKGKRNKIIKAANNKTLPLLSNIYYDICKNDKLIIQPNRRIQWEIGQAISSIHAEKRL